MDVEALAVGKIQAMIARCPHLKSYLTSNDKTPFTDGHIDLYSGLAQKKDDWRGRVSVQVKGRSGSRKRPSQVSFGISRIDLRGFQRDSGILYFYVAVDDRGSCRPYYAILSPFAIEHHLRAAPERQSTISIPFKPFPDRPAEIQRIAALALKTKEQRLSLGSDATLFETMKSLTIHSAVDLDLSAPLLLTPGVLDFALEITTEGGLTLPLGGELHIYPQSYVEHSRDIAIKAGGITYERVSTRRLDAETVELHLGPSVQLSMRQTASQRIWTVQHTAAGNLLERLRAARFLIGLLAEEVIEVDGAVSPLGDTADDSNGRLEELRRHLASLVKVEELFDHLGVDGARVDLDEVNGRGHEWLQALHRAFVRGEELPNESGETARGLVYLGRWAIMMLTVPGSEPGTWRYVDPFDPKAPHLFRWSPEDRDGEESIPVTAYDIVEQEHLWKILNLRLERIVDAYDAIADDERTMSLANQRVLALIAAGDACVQRKEEFLQAAAALNEWIIEHEGETAVHLINRWQILYRTTGLLPQHLVAVRALKRRVRSEPAERADEIELSCALLLDDGAEATYLVGAIPEETLATMRTWPIWRLHIPE